MVDGVQRQYDGRVVLRVADSSRRTTLMCHGEGVEPHLEFSRSHLHLGAVVPYFAVEEEVSICNPCNFPIELYSLEFDQMHLEDEKVLSCHRMSIHLMQELYLFVLIYMLAYHMEPKDIKQ